MYQNPFQISLDTFIGASRIFGHYMEDRSMIRGAQDTELMARFQGKSNTPLRDESQKDTFCVAPLDILVSEENGKKVFHIIEINGTGIGGLTNMLERAVAAVLQNMFEFAQNVTDPSPVILVASSGFEVAHQPRQNKLIYEKVLYAEALKRGFGKGSVVTSLPQLRDDPRDYWIERPTVVLGYMKEFLNHLRLEPDGRLTLFERPITGIINDRFFLNVLHHFGSAVDLTKLKPVNRSYQAGGDKGVAYKLLNQYFEIFPSPIFPKQIFSDRASTREELIETVFNWLAKGRKPVIKPQGTGLGHGIEFFLNPNEPREQITARIDHSLQLTEAYYGIRGGALPYTICEFIDTCTISKEGHPLFGHKYEIRVVIYRNGMELEAFPSITKVSSQIYDAAQPSHLSLINNITTSSVVTGTLGTEHMMPLCNRGTLDLLGIELEEMEQVCAGATKFIRFVLDQIQDKPDRFGLA